MKRWKGDTVWCFFRQPMGLVLVSVYRYHEPDYDQPGYAPWQLNFIISFN
ncbi:hypothetical protein [Tellurirhabdus bombi]|nr:hypothetical protein [Tellurirhabdus bombi]